MNRSNHVANEWTEWGIYTGQVQRIGRSKDFVMQGEGKLVLKYPNKKTVVYTGTFQQDKKHGLGRQVTHAPDNESEVLELIEGQWKMGYLHGHCTVTKPDGSCFDGLYLKGKREGYGRDVQPSGEWCEGTWHGNQI